MQEGSFHPSFLHAGSNAVQPWAWSTVDHGFFRIPPRKIGRRLARTRQYRLGQLQFSLLNVASKIPYKDTFHLSLITFKEQPLCGKWWTYGRCMALRRADLCLKPSGNTPEHPELIGRQVGNKLWLSKENKPGRAYTPVKGVRKNPSDVNLFGEQELCTNYRDRGFVNRSPGYRTRVSIGSACFELQFARELL